MGRGLRKAVVDKSHEYIIGIIAFHHFCPLVVPKPNRPLNYVRTNAVNYERVKVRLSGPILQVTEPISSGDPLNDKFFKNVKKSRLIDVEIVNP